MKMRKASAIYLIFVSLMFGPFVYAKNPKGSTSLSNIEIHITDGMAKNITEEQVREILPVREGDILTNEKLNETLDYLRKWGVFDAIQVKTTMEEDTHLALYLTQAILIGNIEIKGNYPYIEQRIKKYLTIRTGDIFTRDRIEEQIKRIKEFYEREGFWGTNVSVKEAWNEATGDVIITFDIKRGRILRYGNISVLGDKYYPKGRVISALNPLRPYQPRRFNEAIRKTLNFYRHKGFPRARIEVVRREPDFEKNRINVEIKITEGQRIGVDFIGNKGLTNGKLKKVITIFEEGSYDEYELEASQTAITDLYHKNGFPDAAVTASRRAAKDGSIVVEFRISEGNKQHIKNIEFTGNRTFSSYRLKKGIKTKIYNKKAIDEDLKSVKKYYGGKGYINVEIGEPKKEETRGLIKLTVPISEGNKVTVQNIIFTGNLSFSREKLSKILKNRIGQPLNSNVLEEEKQSLLVFYADNGFPHAETRQTVEGGDIKYEIMEGPLVKIGKILIVGNSLTVKRAIKKAMSIHEGEPFSYKRITDSQLAIRRLGAFNAVSVDTIGLTEKERVVHLRVKVEEQEPFIVDLEMAYSTDESYSGSINFTNLNSFGLAKVSNLKLTGGRELSRAEVSWTDPRFLGSDLEMIASSWLQYKDKNVFNYVQAGGGFGFFRRYHRTGLLAKYELTRNYFINGDSTAADADSLRDNTISKIALSLSFDTRNSFSEPTRGIFAMMNSDFYNEIKGKGADFVKLRWSFGNYLGFLKYLSIANTIRIDQIQTLGSNVSVPTSELLFLGGDDTLRGFSEDSLGPTNAGGSPTGGRLRFIYNGELRIKLFKDWRWAVFYDTGTLVNNAGDISLATLRQSTGFGLRYLTPVGPIRLDYGILLDRAAGEHFGRLHFTFGYVF